MSDSTAPTASMEVDTPVTATSETVVAAPEASSSTTTPAPAVVAELTPILPEEEEIAAKTLAQGEFTVPSHPDELHDMEWIRSWHVELVPFTVEFRLS